MYRLLVAAVAGVFTMAVAHMVSAQPAPPPVFNWTGFYVGGTIGYGWGSANNAISVNVTDRTGGNAPFSYATNDSPKVRGVLGGIDAGYNWQMGNLLLGFETDFKFSNQKGTATLNSSVPVPLTAPGAQPVNITDKASLKWLGTTRARLGYAKDRWLIFATGGLAYGEVELNGNADVPVSPSLAKAFGWSNAPWTWSGSDTKLGWALGAGGEYAVTSNLSLKLEFLYVDLGDVTTNVSGGLGNIGVAGPGNCVGGTGGCAFYRNPASGTVTSHFTDKIVQFGVNYKF